MFAKFVDKNVNISSRMIDGSSYIYIEDEKKLLKLNEVGSFIWEKINGNTTINQIIKLCLSEYYGNKKEITQSILEFFDILLKEGVIKISQNKIKEG